MSNHTSIRSGSRQSSASDAAEGSKYASFASQGYSENGFGGMAGESNAYRGWQPDEDEVEQIQQRTRELKGETVESSLRALAKLAQAEAAAGGNLEKLHRQGEQLRSVERRIEVADAYAQESDAKTSELKRLNRWFFLPTWGGGSEKNRAKNMSKGDSAKREYEARKASKVEARQQALGTSFSSQDFARGSSSRGAVRGAGAAGEAYERGHPEGNRGDDMDREIDANLEGITRGVGRLRAMAQAMTGEMDDQNERIVHVKNYAETTGEKVKLNTHRVNNL